MVNARSLTFHFFSFGDCTPDSGKSLHPSLATLGAVVAGATTGMSFQSHTSITQPTKYQDSSSGYLIIGMSFRSLCTVTPLFHYGERIRFSGKTNS